MRYICVVLYMCSEETRGVGGVLARNNIAGYPRQTKANQDERGTKGMGSSGGGEGDEGMCGNFADLALEPSLGKQCACRLKGVCTSQRHSSRTYPLPSLQGIYALFDTCKSISSEAGGVYEYIASALCARK